MKIAVALPVDLDVLTHAAQMVCQELVLSLLAAGDGLELELITPEQLVTQFEFNPIVAVPGRTSHLQVLRYEQFELPRLAKESGAGILLMPYEAAPLKSPLPVLVFEALGAAAPPIGVSARLLQAVRTAGVRGVSQHLVYKDLKDHHYPGDNLKLLDPWVHGSFQVLTDSEDRQVATRYGLPYSYVLAHGVSNADIPALLAAWTWVDGSVGDTVPLAVLVSGPSESRNWERVIKEMGLEHSLRLLHGVRFDELPALYRRAEALLQGGQAIEHQILRWAMACGVPVVGFDVPAIADVLGSAGYLVDRGDTRALGAACLTVIVEPEVKERLRQEGLVRASAFHANEAPDAHIRRSALALTA
jgi:hypothetical protein